MYRVIERFRDLTDGHLYEAGDPFPHDGRDLPADRLSALASGKNGAGRALIAPEDEPEAIEKTQEEPKKPARSRRKAQ